MMRLVYKVNSERELVRDAITDTLVISNSYSQLTDCCRSAGCKKDSACFQDSLVFLVGIYAKQVWILQSDIVGSSKIVEASNLFVKGTAALE